MNSDYLPVLRSELDATQKCLHEQIVLRGAAEQLWHPQLAGGPLDRIMETQAAVALLERRVASLQSKISAIEIETKTNSTKNL